MSRYEDKIMPKENHQKMKMLKLMEMLLQDSDEEHPLLTNQIIHSLNEMGITCDRRTVRHDMELLNTYGYEVQSRFVKHEKGYYVMDRQFSVPELKILIDAVQAASFITPNKTNEFIDKIANLGGSYRASILESNMVCFNTAKHSNEAIYYTISKLENALQNKKKASFYYFDRDENGRKVYRKNMKRYIVDPMALIFNDDNYYLMCYSEKYKGICNYRLDRMEIVNIEQEDIVEEAIMDESDIASYTEQVFKMYGGEAVDVELEFKRSLIGVVQDKFGEDVKMKKASADTCIALIKVQIAPTFWGWLFQFVGEMKIISPKYLVQEYKDRAYKLILSL